MIKKKGKITKTECIRLLYLTINYDVYLWVFKTLFEDKERDYKYYLENRIYISRITLPKKEFEEIRTLLQKYSK